MQKYSVDETLGEGSFAVVYKARTKDGTPVAIKQIKERQASWEACLSIRELRVLKTLGKHPNIMALRELISSFRRLFGVPTLKDGWNGVRLYGTSTERGWSEIYRFWIGIVAFADV